MGSRQTNADAWTRRHCLFAQQTPTPPSMPAPPLASPAPAAPVSAKPQPTVPQPKAKAPSTVHGCTVTFDHMHLSIELPGQPGVSLALTQEQQAAIDARLSQKTPGGHPEETPTQPLTPQPPVI